MSLAHFEFVTKKMAELAPSGNLKCLDFGCGGGDLIVHARKKGFDIVGLDLESLAREKNRPAIEKNSLTIGEDIFLYDGGTLPFADESFDMVIANMVFEHIAEPRKYVQEIHRILKKGGCFLALFPTAEAIWEGHLLLYFVHKMNKFEKLQFKYITLMDKLGLGVNHKKKPEERVPLERLHNFLRNGCFYHPSKEIFGIWQDVFGSYPATDEVGYLSSRLSDHSKLRPLAKVVQFPPVRPFAKLLTIIRLTRVLSVTK